MTNKEAREILRTIGFHIPVVHTGIKHPRDFYEAIDLAIKALEREADLEQAVVNIKMSEEEIKQFKQMLREHNLLYSITSNTFVEGASVERPKGEWIVDEDAFSKDFRKCSNCNEDAEWLEGGCQFLPNFCPNCGADMRGGRG